jgi:hypothetical protein
MEHMKAFIGNAAAWIALIASVFLPILQVAAAVMAIAASTATFIYFRKKHRKEHRAE